MADARKVMEDWYQFYKALMIYFQSRLDLEEEKLDLKVIPSYEHARKKILEILNDKYDHISVRV